MPNKLTLLQLEGLAVAFLDLAATLKRPLLAAEKKAFRFVLVEFDAPSIKKEIASAEKKQRAYYAWLADLLAATLGPEHFTLDHLERITIAFLDFVDTLDRPLLDDERKAFYFVLGKYESAGIKAAIAEMDDGRREYYAGLIVRLVAVLDREHVVTTEVPDPVRPVRLHRDKPELVAERNQGNYSLKAPPFHGVSIRRLNGREAAERVTMIYRLADGIGCLAQELALACNRDKVAMRDLVRLARRMNVLATRFADGFKGTPAIPAERSMDEVLADMEAMGKLMEGPDE